MARIMIVEDNRALGGTLSLLVECAGHAVTWVTGGAEALTELARCEHEVVFADVIMSPMDGFTLVKKIREKHPQVVCVFLSGENDPARKAQGMKLGALEYVQKPIRFDDFKSVLQRALHRAEKVRAGRPAPTPAPERSREHVAEELEPFLPGAPLALVRSQLAELALSSRHGLIQTPAGMLTPELLHALHRVGSFAEGPLVVHDAAAEPLTDVEALLESAPEGLILLANVEAVPAGLQHALAQRLRQADRMRVIATIGQNAEALKAEGRLFGPLAAHLELCSVQLPALAQFEGKLPEIFAAALAFVPGYPAGKSPLEIEDEAAQALAAYPWPGNLTELWQVAGRVAPGLRDHKLSLSQLPEAICATQLPRLDQFLRAAEVEHVRRALRLHGAVPAAAKALGVTPAALEAYQNSSAAESLFTLKGRNEKGSKTEPIPRLLLVAGDEVVRATAQALLAERGVEVVAVADGLAAVAAVVLARQKFTAAVLVPPFPVWQASELGAQLLRISPRLKLALLGEGSAPVAPFHNVVPVRTDLAAALGTLAQTWPGRAAA